ncbi:fungal-specific transcription factor domain-containing protein [Aspergillus pseudodeflectus]|uniref:Fungal-specific transcription factor domain-containing protein n=1 Tax=Aspergillus pseudodeflectus TaxID=176178 RepID=A0ABR4JDE9_9EURO
MHLAQSVLNAARLNDPLINHVPPDLHHTRTEPVASQDPAPSANLPKSPRLPSEEVALNLIEIFLDQYQLQYPIVSQEWLVQKTHEFYLQRSSLDGSLPGDTCTAFVLQMVFAISLLSISKGDQGDDALSLAEGFYASAMSTLTNVMENKGLKTLQCLLLLLLYSLLHLSATPIWHISGLSLRMCIDLGLQSEASIKVSPNGIASDLEIDFKRRLFWATYTLDRTLSIMLGRPFTLEDKYIDVAYPELTLPEDKRRSIIHWIKLQRLQSIAVSRYHSVSDNQATSQSICSKDLANELAAWIDEASSLTDPTRYTLDWWRYWYHNTLLIIHRPSPNSPSQDLDSLYTCYTSAKNVIEASFIRLHTDRLGVSCVDIHYQFMAGITLLFLVWNSAEIRKHATKEWASFKSCLVQWELILEKMASLWESANRAREVARKLSTATVDIVEREIAQASNTQTMYRDGRILRAREQKRVKFIMDQISSPGTNNLATYGNIVASARCAAKDTYEVAESSCAVHSPAIQSNDAYEESSHQQAQRTYLHPDPVLTSFPNDPMMTDETTIPTQGYPWQEAEFDQISQMLRGALEDPVLPFSDLSAIFGDTLWSTSSGPENSMYNADNMNDIGGFSNLGSGSVSILGDTWLDNAGRARNMAWADSVLNFPEDWENNSPIP